MRAITELERLGYTFSLDGDTVRYAHRGERPAPAQVRPVLNYLHRHREEAIRFLQERIETIAQLATEVVERWPHDPPPAQPCGVSPSHTTFWRRPWKNTGGWVCAICHPPPSSLEVETWTVKDEGKVAPPANPDVTVAHITELQRRLWDGHRKIAAARTAGKPAPVIEDAEHHWCDLLGQLNRALCGLGELEPTYTVGDQAFVTYGCEDMIQEVTR